MSALAAARSSLLTSLLRYRRSLGLWLILLVAPVGARFMVAGEDGGGVMIAIGNQLPEMTAPVLGIWLGIVVSTLLLPVAWGYLRSNTTRRQPWQVEDVTPASRVAMALGRFAADAAVLLAVLMTLTFAGLVLNWVLAPDDYRPLSLAYGLWLVAAPPLIGLAALRTLFDARPLLRGRLGDAGFFVLWMASIIMPSTIEGRASDFASNLRDFAGYYRPLVGGAPEGSDNFAIGGVDLKPGRMKLDAEAGLASEGYAASRIAWLGIAVALAAFAGLVYRPRKPRRRLTLTGWIGKLLEYGPPPAADPAARAARPARLPLAGLVLAEARLIGAGRAFLLFALAAAASGLLADYRHVGSAAALLLLVFALSGHAGQSEAKGLLALTRTAPTHPMTRRLAFIAAGTGLSLLMALPATALRLSPEPLLLAGATGLAASTAATLLAALTRSAFTPRLVLLIAWYGYLSS